MAEVRQTRGHERGVVQSPRGGGRNRGNRGPRATEITAAVAAVEGEADAGGVEGRGIDTKLMTPQGRTAKLRQQKLLVLQPTFSPLLGPRSTRMMRGAMMAPGMKCVLFVVIRLSMWRWPRATMRSCSTCVIRQRLLYKDRSCSLCKATTDRIIVTSDRTRMTWESSDFIFGDQCGGRLVAYDQCDVF